MTRLPKKFLYIGLAHSAKDIRLCHFLAKAVQMRFPEIDCYYMGIDSTDPTEYSNEHFTVIGMPRGINPRKRRFRLDDFTRMASHIKDAGIDLVQVSDVRELMLGYAVKKMAGIPVIFDSHEDYFNQKYEYRRKTGIAYVKGMIARSHELLYVRYMDAVFCTDDFLEQMYARPVFDAPSVTMVRNIPARDTIRDLPVSNDRHSLKLVYIGSVNEIRGIIEVADYCKRFNQEPNAIRQGTTLSFHVFSKPYKIIDGLVEQHKIIHHGYVSQSTIKRRISDFDIGVSLIMPSKKFERNILIKNFEYMAMGIPILTSHYGTMKRYVSQAKAGLTIDPTSYDAFKNAILKFSDIDFRRTCGENGIRYAKKYFHRDLEVAPYVDTVGRLLGLTSTHK